MAAGSGERLGNQPKAFLYYQGRTLLENLIAQYSPFVEEMIVAICNDHLSLAQRLTDNKSVRLVSGGHTRHESLKKILHYAKTPWVFVHDVARPFISRRLIEKVIAASAHSHSAIATTMPLPRRDALVIKNDETEIHQLMTSPLYAINTPQLYLHTLLQDCFSKNIPAAYTVSAVSVLNYCGYPVHLIQGDENNIKITYPEDLRLLHENEL